MATEVIENGNSWISVLQTSQENGTSVTKMSVHVTAEEKINKKNYIKARSLLLMALANEHQLTFSQYNDAKTMLQKLVSRLLILGVVITPEDLNSKFLRSFPPEWNTHVVVWMNKADIETMSIDDLYNNFKIVEQEVKKSVGASTGTQNMAFMTTPSTSSTNDVNTANSACKISIVSPNINTFSSSVSTANINDNVVYAFMVENPNGSNLLQQDLEQIHEDDLEAMDLKWQLSLLSMRAKRYYQRTGKKIFINANDTARYDKSKVECFNCHKMGYFARECRAPRNKDGQFRYQDNSRNQESPKRTVNVEYTSSKAMLAIDGVGYDWSDMSEEQIQTSMALMAFLDSEVYNDKSCSKTYLKNYETLKKQCDNLIVKLNETEFKATTYKRGLATIEDQLITFRKNEVLFSEEIAVLKREVGCKDYEIGMLKTEFEKIMHEKEGIDFKTAKFDDASKCLDKLLESQITDKSKKGLGYHVVAPPHPLSLNAPTKLDFVLISSVESLPNVVKETVFHVAKKVEFVKPTNNEKPVKKLVSFDHMKINCPHRQRKRMVTGNNYNRVDYDYYAKTSHTTTHRIMTPRAVLLKTALKPLSTVRPIYTVHPKPTVYSAKSMSQFSKQAQSTVQRPFYMKPTFNNKYFNQKVNTVRPRVVNTARPYTAPVNTVRANRVNVVKSSAYPSSVDNGCSRHMTRNIAYLSNFKEFDRGYVTFGGGACGGRISSKGTLKTNSLDFDDLLDENQILLKIPREDNISFDMKNIVPKESLTCLVAKLVKDNLVRGLPLKLFENDQTCVACLKGKQHRASFYDKHNMVAYLHKSEGSEGFHQIINFLNASHIQYALTENPTIYVSFIKQFWRTATARTSANGEVELNATIDGQVKTVTEASLRRHLKLEDNGGITTLPNTEIFEQLALIGYETDSDKLTFQKGHFSPQWRFLIHTILYCLSLKKNAWEQFSSSIATAIICLATNGTFNFSKMIFDAMVKNVDSTHKFLMYPKFIQICLNMQKRHLQPHTRTYATHSLTNKVFSNMKRVSRGYSGIDFPLFPTMLTAPETSPSRITSSPSLSPESSFSPQHTPASTPSTSQPPNTQPTPDAEEAASMPHESPLQSVHLLRRDEGNLSLTELMVLCTSLSKKVEGLESELKTTKHTYSTALTKLIKRVKKLEQTIKTSKARRRAKIVVSEDEDAPKDSSKQGRKIYEIDKDPTISLVHPEHEMEHGVSTAEETSWFQEDADIQIRTSNDTEVLLEEEEPTELMEDRGSGEKEVSTAKVQISTASATPKISTAAENLVYVIRSAVKRKDKGKGIMTELEPKKKTKLQQRQERSSLEAAIRQLHEEINKAEQEKKEVVTEADLTHDIDWSDPAVIRYHVLQNKPRSVAEVRKNMCIYLCNQEGYKMRYFKGMSYEDIRPIFEKVWDQIHSFVPMDSEVEVHRLKRKGQEVQEEPVKRQRTGKVLEDDLVKLWSLVQERLNSPGLTKDKEKELWVELKMLFEPDEENLLELQRYMHDPLKWWLYDTCAIHHVSTEKG
ncbi:putative ribonuclease H-like domain-containing protein [Tanacetum coccineum]